MHLRMPESRTSPRGARMRWSGSTACVKPSCGVRPSPFDGEPVLACVTYGKVKLANLRARPQVSVASVGGWQWSTVEGRAAIIGPDDPHDDVDAERLRMLLREVFVAAGGTHDDWDEYDRVMRPERRAAVPVTPTRMYPG